PRCVAPAPGAAYRVEVRIAIVSTPFVPVPPPAYGGTELVVHALYRALARAGHDVTVFATGDSTARGVRAFFERAVWPPDPYSEILHCRFAAQEIAAGGYDVVHANVPAMLAFADELRPPMVYTLHHALEPTLARFYERVEGVRLVAISERQAELARPAPHDVVHHGLDPELYPVAGTGGGGAFFLGRLSWCKAPEVAIEAAARAGVPITVAGAIHGDAAPEGWRERVLAPALRRPHVSWVREADLAAKRRLFATSRALLVPLRWDEPFGLVMIEAALAGCPVIASPSGAAPEIVEDGETGFLVRSEREMAAALRRVGALDRRAIQARARHRFGADRMAAGYLAVYRAAIAERMRLRLGGAPAAEDGWTTLAQ
uniref:glycosyltransferase family 4 protein n=1 Tax=Anaeromyxobacter sp. SG66 TaxID=2925410 RepID=UPI001F58DE9F